MVKWVVPLAIAGASLLGAEAQVTGRNFASCVLSGQASGSAEDARAVASAASVVAANVCGDQIVNDEDVANQVATATASAIANQTVACTTSGLGTFTVNGLSIGQSRATAVAEAFVTALATAPACENCTAVANFTGASFSEILLNATAQAEVNLDSATSTDPVVLANDFAEDIRTVVIRAFANAISTARSSATEDCSAEILAAGVTGEVGDPNPNAVFCSVFAFTDDQSTATSIVAEASAEAAALAGCTPDTSGTVERTSTLLAEAFARALTVLALSCDVRGEGNLCAAGETQVLAVVEATAGAFARTLANATAECGDAECTVAAEIVVEAITPVASQAAAGVTLNGCIGSDASLTAAEVDLVTNQTTVTAFAEAISEAIADAQQGCVIRTNTTATTTPNPPVVTSPETRPPPPPPPPPSPLPCDGECAPQGRKCAGLNFPVALPCCDEGFLCVQRTPAFAQCRFQGIPGLFGWDGTIIPCGTPGPP